MNHLAQWGTVDPPPGVSRFAGGSLEGIPLLLNIILRSAIMVAAIYTLINFILAGYGYLSAGGDPKKIQDASTKIWQSIIGLVITAGAFGLAAIIGLLVFGDAAALLQVRIFEPAPPTP
jgi:hypothetical protein